MKNATQTAALGIQHVLAMYAGAVIVPLIVGQQIGLNSEQLTYLIAIDILMCGVATILQIMNNRFFGIGLPVVLGCTFTAVSPLIAIGNDFGITAIYGAIIVSGLFIILISRYFGMLVRFFPPVVTGTVVTTIGLTLIPVAFNDVGGGAGASDFGSMLNLSLAFGTLLLIILVYRFTIGFLKAISILIGLLAGTVAAILLGIVDFTPVKEASFVHMVQPFYFGMPTFEWSAILTMILVAMVSMVESTGVYFALGDICDRELKQEDLAKGYRAEGIAVLLGGIFNSLPYTTFSQNVGLVQMSGVKSRRVIFVTGVMLMMLGFIPKIAALTMIIPKPVLGGAMIAMFGMVIAQGIRMLSKAYGNAQENSMIIACSIGIGLGVTIAPELFENFPKSFQMFTSNGIVAGSLTAILLNIIFNMIPSSKNKDKDYTEQKA